MLRIVPQPEPDDRDVILAALAEPPPQGGEWAAVALREAVSPEVDPAFTHHDVCSLW